MRPLRTFTISPSLPEELSALHEIAYNLRWCWNDDARQLFRRLAPQKWEQCYHNPVALLGLVEQERLGQMADDESFLAHLARVRGDLHNYLEHGGWWTKTYGAQSGPQVAYFCAEFGITECLPIYSGGLGVLAGDHLKSASELDIPLVGVGLLYQQGYFRQRLNADGWQLELFPRNDFHNLPVQPVNTPDGSPLMIEVDMADHKTKAQVWRIQVGRISLYTLDANVPENSPADRQITAQLYGGDQETRIRQEIILGIGGVRMLKALGLSPKAYHINEGHSAFLGLERIRMLMTEQNVTFDEAREAVTGSNVFTTHTPVPAGNDAFETWLVEKYFSNYWPQLGLSRDKFMAMGRQEPGNEDEPMSLTVLAMRLSASRNSVSKLHNTVSRKLWASVWPGVPTNEIPIRGITNGIHTPSWISDEIGMLYDRYLGPGWHEKPADSTVWTGVQNIPDTELWRTHERRRERLVAFSRKRLRQQLVQHGASASEIDAAGEVLDPEALTIGFARRFATYKRANLILRDPDRLAELLNAPDRKVQIIFAGKAHPKDNPGKELIRQIVHMCRKDQFRRSLLFLEDYDMNSARYLVQGVDIWLNTPLRPMEASGTSGMKVAANGGLNVSVLDGWWAEGYHPDVGWAIGSGESYDDLDYQNIVEGQALYNLLEKEIVPLFYDRGSDNLPRGWIAKMKATMSRLAPVYNTNRMVRQYTEMFYIPAAKRWDDMVGANMEQAKQLSKWKQKLRKHFGDVHLDSVSDDVDTDGGAQVGRPIHVEAVVNLGKLSPEDVAVELFYGALDDDGQLNEGKALPMQQSGAENSRIKYVVDVPCKRSGMTGYTVRVTPQHKILPDALDMAMIRWA